MKLYDKSLSTLYENDRKLTIFSLAFPLFLERVSTGLISTTNTVLLSGYGQDAVTATGIVGQVTGLMDHFLIIPTIGLRVILGLELGRKNRDTAVKTMGTAFWMVLLSSLLFGFFLSCFSGNVLELMNLYGKSKEVALGYAKISFLLFFITSMKGYFSIALTCNGYTKHSAFSVVLAQILNLVSGYFILYGDFGYSFNRINALAIRSAVSQLIAMSYLVFILIKKKCPLGFRFERAQMSRILKLGFPASINGIGYGFGQTVTTSIITGLGTGIITTKIYIGSIVAYVPYFSHTLGQATSIMMSRMRGMEQQEKENRLFWQSVRLAIMMNLTVSVLIFTFRKQLIGIFTDDPAIISLAGAVLFVDILVQIARAATNICDQSLTANGDVKVVSAVSLSACCGVTILFAWLFGVRLGWGLVGCWMAFVLEEVYKSSLYILRWKSGKWKHKVI